MIYLPCIHLIYIFNSNENKTIDSEQSVSYTLPESKKELNATFVAHTYAVIKETTVISNGEVRISVK